MERNVILQLDNLQTKFRVGKRLVGAVNGVNLSLRRGKTLGVVGESGCGKSVTAHSILQLLPKAGFLAGGSVTYAPEPGRELVLSEFSAKGRDIRSIRGQDIAMVFQDPMSTLNPVYTIGSQIMENLLQHEKLPRKAARARVIALLRELGIPNPTDRFDEYPHQFSGGMKQRVMIAIAMVCNPKILIADEPTTALDVTIQAQILGLMQKLQHDCGTSIILITHNMGIVAEVCDDVAVMYMGRVVEFGSLEQVFTNPLHPYTKALMKSVPVLGMGKDGELESIEGCTPDAATVFTGCEFASRCACADERCSRQFPVDTTLADGHCVRCLRIEEELGHG